MCGVYSQQKHRFDLWYKELHLFWSLYTASFHNSLLQFQIIIEEKKLLWGYTWIIRKQKPTEGVDSFMFWLSALNQDFSHVSHCLWPKPNSQFFAVWLMSFSWKSNGYILRKCGMQASYLSGSAKVFQLPFIEVTPWVGYRSHYK